MNLFKSVFFFSLFFSTNFLIAQITIVNTDTPAELVADVLVGEGVEITNVQFNHSTPDASVTQTSVGYFSAVGTTFPITEGIVMASGNVAVAEGPNDTPSGSSAIGIAANLGTGGTFIDNDLEAIATETIFHESIIEFDFVPNGSYVSFNYVFASEEYLEFVDAGFSDVFGFFVSGPGFAGPFELGAENLAVISGTIVPVCIDNINNLDFPELYINNDGGVDIQHDGYTVSLETGFEVICGETYHIKLAIGDAGDPLYDSAVFLEASSFSSNAVMVEIESVIGEDALLEGCDSARVSFIRPTTETELILDYVVSGSATNGIDYVGLDGDVIFPIGVDTFDLWIVPQNDALTEGTEFVTVTLAFVNACGDTIISESTIEILDAPPIELATTDVILNCPIDSVALGFEIIAGGSPDFDILWSTGEMDSNIWVTGTSLDTTTYSVMVEDACGAIATASVNVVLDITPIELATTDVILNCPSDSVALGFEIITGGVPDFDILWSTGETDSDIWVTGTGLDTTTYTVTVEDACGAVAIASLNVILEIAPIELATTDVILNCPTDSVALGFDIISGGIPDFDISWSNGETTSIIWVPGTSLGTTTYLLTVEDACGAVANASVGVVLEALATPPINFEMPSYAICVGETQLIDISVLAIDGAAIDYTWTPTGETSEDITVMPIINSWYTVTADNGCGAVTDSVFVAVTNLTVEAVLGEEICAGDCSGSISLTPLGGLFPYSYSIDNCVTVSAFGDFSDLCSGDYNICVTEGSGCEFTNTIHIEEGIPISNAMLSSTLSSVCVNETPIDLLTTGTIGELNGDGIVDGSFDPAIAGVGEHLITYDTPGVCGNSDSLIIIVRAVPAVSFSGDILNGCGTLSTVFTNMSDAGTNCTWDFGDGTIINTCGMVSHDYEIPGLFAVSLMVEDENGCRNSFTANDFVEVFELPIADFTYAPDSITTLDPEVVFMDNSLNGDSWEWNFAGLGTSIIENPTFSFPFQAGIYEVEMKVKTINGCEDTKLSEVVVTDPVIIYVPNAFTPDGDTYNEVFKPYLSGFDIYDYHLTIFNRWGEVVFESFDIAQGWNGTYGDRGIVKNDVYIWSIEVGDVVTDKRFDYNGHVTLLK